MLLDFTKAKVKKVAFGDLEEGQFYILDKNTDFAFGGELCIKTRDNQQAEENCVSIETGCPGFQDNYETVYAFENESVKIIIEDDPGAPVINYRTEGGIL